MEIPGMPPFPWPKKTDSPTSFLGSAWRKRVLRSLVDSSWQLSGPGLRTSGSVPRETRRPRPAGAAAWLLWHVVKRELRSPRTSADSAAFNSRPGVLMHFSPCSSLTLVAQENGDSKTKSSDSWSQQRSLSHPGSRRASHPCISFEVFSLGAWATLQLFLRKARMVIAPAPLHGVGLSEWASLRSLERFLTHRGSCLLTAVVRSHRPRAWAWSRCRLLSADHGPFWAGLLLSPWRTQSGRVIRPGRPAWWKEQERDHAELGKVVPEKKKTRGQRRKMEEMRQPGRMFSVKYFRINSM